MMIFDGHHRKEDWEEHVYMRELMIIYSAHGKTADETIIERLKYHHFSIRPVVVSSDKKILQNAKELRFETLSSQSFIHLCNKESCHTEEKVYEESQKETERLQKIFENKLKDR